MNYFIDLFSPETAKAFESSPKNISGFRISRKTYIDNQKLGPGDKFICYVTRLQRFIGILEVTGKYFIDDKPIFANANDPFVLRFKVKPVVWLTLEKAIPINQDFIWNQLSFTKNLDRNNPKEKNNWTYMVFSSPRVWPREDCKHIEKLLIEQSKKMVDYPFSEDDQKKLKIHKIKFGNKKEVTVSVPDDEDEQPETVMPQEAVNEKRESLKVQAKLAEVGEKLGMKIWVPRSDRAGVLENWKPQEGVMLEELPLVFDETTLKTIKNIDVLWIRRRSIIRAFEVEDKTSIYSGILRMADLLALQPMLDIKIHIVAPTNRREEVFKQISRPVFAVMERGPLSELCSYISYDSAYELSKEKHLENMKDTILDSYSEFSEE
jgi:hypothetical protein